MIRVVEKRGVRPQYAGAEERVAGVDGTAQAEGGVDPVEE